MAGLIDTGTDYKNRALSGFIRESADQEKIDVANDELSAQRKIQKAKTSAEGAMIGGLGGYMLGTSSWAAGAELGAAGGPLGVVIGAGLGFMFSQLF